MLLDTLNIGVIIVFLGAGGILVTSGLASYANSIKLIFTGACLVLGIFLFEIHIMLTILFLLMSVWLSVKDVKVNTISMVLEDKYDILGRIYLFLYRNLFFVGLTFTVIFGFLLSELKLSIIVLPHNYYLLLLLVVGCTYQIFLNKKKYIENLLDFISIQGRGVALGNVVGIGFSSKQTNNMAELVPTYIQDSCATAAQHPILLALCGGAGALLACV
jgi:hypothetical protein